MSGMKLLKHILSIPFIWLPVFPAFAMHLSTFIYQAICFRLYGIERVKLRPHMSFDREKLSYLSLVDKLNCAYCSYMNALFPYITEITRRTEYYWCGVKHRNQPNNPAFAYQAKFAEYGDPADYEAVKKKSGRAA